MPESVELQLELNNDIAEIARLSEAVEDFCARCEMKPQMAFNLNLVLEEIVTNVIEHGLLQDGAPGIVVVLRRKANDVQGEVRDRGPAFDPLQLPAPDLTLDIEHRAAGGLGVYFLKTLTDRAAYSRNAGENCLRFNMTLAQD